MTLGEALKTYRKKHKLVQKELAALAGISLKHYALIERDKAHPSHIVLKRICNITKICIKFTFNKGNVSGMAMSYLAIKNMLANPFC